MNKKMGMIVGGLGFLLILSVAVLLGLNIYMDGQTEKDVRNIANVHLEGMTNSEVDRFDSIKDIRFSQIDSMIENVEEMGESVSHEEIKKSMERSANFQDLATCALIADDGTLETIFGDDIVRLGDQNYLTGSMKEKKRIVTGGWSEKEQLAIYAAPMAVKMDSGKESVGVLWCKPISVFAQTMNLDNDDSMVYFHIIRKDSSYVIENEKSNKDGFFSVILANDTPVGMTAQQAVDKLKESIAAGETFKMDANYKDTSENIEERRSVQVIPLNDSDWFLVSVIPYGVLDETIEAMGSARSRGMMVALGAVAVGLILVFGIYAHMTRKQIKELDAARAQAEDAMVEAEMASEEAIKSREHAEEALIEAETANEDAMKAREEALVAKESAEAANKAKSEFLSNMSHDIRTPMNAIVGMTAIAKDHLDDKERVKDCLKKISLSGKQLLGLINDVLDMSKIESGKMTLNMENLSLRETMETMCDIIRPQLKEKNQNFDIYISNIISENVYCDGVRLNQVLLNFLSNAMKFTPEGGAIAICLSQEPSKKGDKYVCTHLDVSDTGIGMSEEFRQKIFSAFEREDNKRVHKIQGTGLGMAITKYIVEAMEGNIEVESEQGKGTTFHVVVDLEKADAEDGEMQLPPWKILVVDDNLDLCQSAVLSLEELGVKPEYCTDGETAVKMVREANENGEDYHALLIDYKMEGMNGIQTTNKIREIMGDSIPISLISAYDWMEIEEEARGVGVTGFIPKPLFKSTLYHELKKFTEDSAANSPQEGETVERVGLEGMRILLAEDNEINAEIAKMILEESGAVVEHGEDGQIVSGMFSSSEEGYYDVILMDLRMPNMNGIEATKNIRGMSRSDASTIPIVALTADAFADDIQKCLDAGMNAHTAKPIDIEMLKSILIKLVNKK